MESVRELNRCASCKIYHNSHRNTWTLSGTESAWSLHLRKEIKLSETPILPMKFRLYPRYVYLRDAKFHVNPKGRDQVRKQKVKNLHAWIRGKPVEYELDPHRDKFGISFVSRILGKISVEDGFFQVFYNPHKDDFFRDESGNKIERASKVWAFFLDDKPRIFASHGF